MCNAIASSVLLRQIALNRLLKHNISYRVAHICRRDLREWGGALGSRSITPLVKAFILTIVIASIGSCTTVPYQVRTGTVRTPTLQQMESLYMDRAAPVVIRIYKEERTLEVWKQDRTGRFALLKSYPICKYSGKLGPKIAQGDYQAPEGFYDITPDQMNPQSSEYLSFNIGFPNAFDRSLGRTGSFLMVHGGCRSVGCYAMTDYGIEEIYGLVYEAFQGGQAKIQLQAFPFRMTTANLVRHEQDPNVSFWQMLKTGNDAFLETGQPPTVAVCDQRYVFNPLAMNWDLDPSSPCPSDITVTTDVAPQSAAGFPVKSGQQSVLYQDPFVQKIRDILRQH
jgi:murein L,D-transpeptidase YafK